MSVLQLHFDVRGLGLVLLPLAGFVFGRRRTVGFHDVREAGPRYGRSYVALNQPDVAHLGSCRCP